MQNRVSRFQEQVALLLGAGVLTGLAFGKRRPGWGGIALAGMGAFLLRGGVHWLRTKPDFASDEITPTDFDTVQQGSVESSPANDSPAWVLRSR